MLVWVHNLNHTLYYIAWCEELTSLLFESITYDSLVSGAFHVNSSIKEAVFGYLRCDIRNATVRQTNLLVSVKDCFKEIILFQSFKDILNSFGNCSLTFRRILFCDTNPELAAITEPLLGICKTTFFIENLTEYQIKKFPKRIFFSTLVAIKIVMTTLKRSNKCIIGSFTRLGTITHVFKIFYGFIATWEIANIFNSFIAYLIFFSVGKELFISISPHSEVTPRSLQCLMKSSLDSFLLIAFFCLRVKDNTNTLYIFRFFLCFMTKYCQVYSHALFLTFIIFVRERIVAFHIGKIKFIFLVHLVDYRLKKKFFLCGSFYRIGQDADKLVVIKDNLILQLLFIDVKVSHNIQNYISLKSLPCPS